MAAKTVTLLTHPTLIDLVNDSTPIGPDPKSYRKKYGEIGPWMWFTPTGDVDIHSDWYRQKYWEPLSCSICEKNRKMLSPKDREAIITEILSNQAVGSSPSSTDSHRSSPSSGRETNWEVPVSNSWEATNTASLSNQVVGSSSSSTGSSNTSDSSQSGQNIPLYRPPQQWISGPSQAIGSTFSLSGSNTNKNSRNGQKIPLYRASRQWVPGPNPQFNNLAPQYGKQEPDYRQVLPFNGPATIVEMKKAVEWANPKLPPQWKGRKLIEIMTQLLHEEDGNRNGAGFAQQAVEALLAIRRSQGYRPSKQP